MECLEWILDNGGSTTDRDNLGGTPVHDAAEQGQVKPDTCISLGSMYLSIHGIHLFRQRMHVSL